MSDAEDLEDGAAQPLIAAVGSIEDDEEDDAKRYPGADLLDHLIRTDMPSKYLVTELIGTFFLTIVSAGTVISSGMLSHHYGYEALSPGRALSIALASGLVRFGCRGACRGCWRVGEGRGGRSPRGAGTGGLGFCAAGGRGVCVQCGRCMGGGAVGSVWFRVRPGVRTLCARRWHWVRGGVRRYSRSSLKAAPGRVSTAA